MTTPSDTSTLDRRVRTFIYNHLITQGKMPMSADIASGMNLSLDEVYAAFARMKDAHVLVPQEQGKELLMASPFSAVPTAFVVETAEHSWWGNCIWDAMGIVAMIDGNAKITAACGDCNDSMILHIENGKVRLEQGEGIIHFSVPAKKWWDNIKFT